jgi:hypothetical protein
MIHKDQRSAVYKKSFLETQDLHVCRNKQATDWCCDYLEFIASNGRMIDELEIGKCLEGTGHGLFEILSGLLPGGTKEIKFEQGSRCARRRSHWPPAGYELDYQR